MQGWRSGMEDAHICEPTLAGSSLALFTVFDGHGGREVACFCKQHFSADVQQRLGMPPVGGTSSSSSSSPQINSFGADVLGNALFGSFHAMDISLDLPSNQDEIRGHRETKANDQVTIAQTMLKESVQHELNQVKARGSLSKEEAVQLTMKMDMLKRLESAQDGGPVIGNAADSVGCTAVGVLVSDTHFVCANAGDSRAVLCRGGQAVALSHDHKPNDDRERNRIERAGATVQECRVGEGEFSRVNYRINGNLNLSRAIGDLQYKRREDLKQEEQAVCSTPDIHTEARSPNDDFLLLACDGIWDVKTNQEACTFVLNRIAKKQPLEKIAEDLLDDCICADPKVTFGLGGDNMTCTIVKIQKDDNDLEPVASGALAPAPALEFSRQDSDAGKQPSGCFPFRCLRT